MSAENRRVLFVTVCVFVPNEEKQTEDLRVDICLKVTNNMIQVHLTAATTTPTASFSSPAPVAHTDLGQKPFKRIRINIVCTLVQAGVVLVFQPHIPVDDGCVVNPTVRAHDCAPG